MILDFFYKKKITSFFILCIITIIMIASIFNIEVGQINNSKYNVYTIEFDYYGIDSKKIEQLITIPLEEKINELQGLIELRSTSEYSKSYVMAYFSKNMNHKRTYLTIRNIVDTLYKDLPSDVQKPRIFSSSINDKSVYTIAVTGQQDVNDIRFWVDHNIKKKFESIDGVSEVTVTGGGQKEILVSFDIEKTVLASQNPAGYSSIIQDGNSVSPGSKIKSTNESKQIVFNTKLSTLDELRGLPVKIEEGYTNLGYMAEIKESFRENNEYVRLNGKECICINIKSASNGNSLLISKECKKILSDIDNEELVFDVLYDNGKKQSKLLLSVFLALIQSFIFVLLIIPVFYSNIRIIISVVLSLLLNILWTLGVIQLCGMNLNQNTLAGITIALGLITDPVLLIGEIADKSKTEDIFYSEVHKTVIAIITASLTTILVLIPLFFMESIVPGIRTIAITMLLMVLNSVIITVIFVPVYMFGSKGNYEFKYSYVLNKILYRISYRNCVSNIKRSKWNNVIYLLLILAPIFLFFFNGRDITVENGDSVVYCSVDYDPDIRGEYINNSLSEFIDEVKKIPEIKFVRTESRKGSADIDIGYYEEKVDYRTITAKLSEYTYLITEGYLYIPGATQKKSKKHLELEIAILGDEEKKCKEFASKTADMLQKTGVVDSVVLNFKDPEKQYVLLPDIERLKKNSISVESLSNSLRWMMFGPVADKWLQNGKEEDIRIVGQNMNNINLDRAKNIHLSLNNSYSIITALGKIQEQESSGKIYRKDGRNCAFITVEMNGLSTNKAVKKIMNFMKTMDLEKGYGFSFPQEILKLKSNYNRLILAFFLCIIGIFILLTIIDEYPKKSLILISIIPSSLVLPLLLRFITNTSLILGDIIGLVMLSGISINNAIYIGESKKERAEFKLREKIKNIVITSLTTIFGSLPLYFMSKDIFSKSLAFFMFFGIINSLFIAITLFPQIYKNGLSS